MYKLKIGNRYKILWHRKYYKLAVSFNGGNGQIFNDRCRDDFKFKIRDIVCFSKLLKVMYEEM